VSKSEVQGTPLLKADKCIFTSFTNRCQFCQDRNITEPCIKIGRDEFKSGTPFNKSVTKSGDCRTEDRMLFEYAYSDQLFLALLDVSELLKTLAAEYGNIPSHASLRHSICALAASYLPSDQFHAQYDNHKRLALAPLMRKIKHHQNFDDTDVFAAGLLVYGIGQGDSSGTDIFAVSKICMSLFRYLTQKEHSGLLSVFGSAVVDFCVTRLVTLRAYPLSSSMPVILTYHTPFSQRLKYYQEICRTTSVPAAWQSSLVEAAFDTVGRLLCLSYLCVSEVLKKEVAGDFERDATVASALEYITAELDDPEFNNYLGVLIDLLPDPSITYETADDWLTVSLLLGIQCVRVFETLLRSTNMMEGLESAKEFFSPDLINLCHTERFKEFPYQYYGFVPFIHGVLLVLIGCTLTDDTLPVISQLQNLGRHETIIGLQLFWMNRNVKNFQRVLENEYPYRKFVNQGAAAQDTPV